MKRISILLLTFLTLNCFSNETEGSIQQNNRGSNVPFATTNGSKVVINIAKMADYINSQNNPGTPAISTFSTGCDIIIDLDNALPGATDKCVRDAGVPYAFEIVYDQDGMTFVRWNHHDNSSMIKNADEFLLAVFREAADCDPVNSITINCH